MKISPERQLGRRFKVDNKAYLLAGTKYFSLAQQFTKILGYALKQNKKQ